jgi:hypothetical protein
LTVEQLETLRRWIEQGARYDRHWAFVPPQRPPLPPLSNSAWVRNPIDAFVLARLEQEGLQPSPPADRITLLRRLSLDLIGLPPPVAEVDSFVADVQSSAYATRVRELLASPHYGEKWGRHWLDAARYADSDGFEKDKPRDVWFYRDWVIRALNDDMPYDQFIREQLAGDLLPDATQDQVVATGFLRNSMINEEGGIDPEQFRMEAMFDRMDAVGKAILGLTIQCAQCHTHKYDPLTQTDYYRMLAFLNNSHEAQVTVYTRAQQQQRTAIREQIERIEQDLRQGMPDWAEQLAAWERQRDPLQSAGSWTIIRDPTYDAEAGQRYFFLADGSVLAQGYAPTQFTEEFIYEVPQVTRLAAFRLEFFNDPNLPHGGPGRSPFGLFGLSEFDVDVVPLDRPEEKIEAKFSEVSADVNPAERELDKIFDNKSGKRRVTGPIAMANDDDSLTAWTPDQGAGRSNVPHEAVFVLTQPIESKAGFRITVKLGQQHGGWNSDDNQNNNVGRFRVAVTADRDARARSVPATVHEILLLPPDQRTPAQQAELFSYWRTTVPAWSEANQAIERLWQQHPQGVTQLVLQERPRPRETHRLVRGDFLKPAEAVEPGTPDFLNPFEPGALQQVIRRPAEGSATANSRSRATWTRPIATAAATAATAAGGSVPAVADTPPRLQFAHWIVDRQAPTVARAAVNRIWQSYFGRGLVATAEDLGTQGDPPSHPELLDWLAVELMDNGWSLKHLHELITDSATYRQASRVTPELLARDPDNRLLARGPRVRVDGEIVRDIALAASGLLNTEVGGPSVYPPAPEFLFEPPASYGPKRWAYDTGSEKYRRALYTFRFRSVPYPVLQTFDAPNADFSCVRRTRSNTPLQALTTLNETLFVESARALALRALEADAADDQARITFIFRQCVARAPTAPENAVLTDFLQTQRARLQRGELDASSLVLGEATRRDEKADVNLGDGRDAATLRERAAWTSLCRVVLNLDETITKE